MNFNNFCVTRYLVLLLLLIFNFLAKNQAKMFTRFSYGLFQINSKNWCRKGRKGGICNIKCEDFLSDEISDDSRCAMQIFNRHGFQAWPGWVNKCRGRAMPDVSRC
uniref:lysozyme n=1 Tax=Glossina palpalis gambiensis TaxID=67801 RepID=A0A1B0BC26_9MUSC